MQNKTFGLFGFLGGILLFILAGWAGYVFYPQDSGTKFSGDYFGNLSGETAKSVSIHSAPSQNSDEQLETEDAISLSDFAFNNWYEEESSNGQVKACFAFTDAVATTRESELRPFIDIEPSAKVAISVEGDALCLGGLSYNKDYRVTLKAGLPSDRADVVLGGNQTVNIGFGDKPAFVGFTDNGIILPKTDTGGLAIETVNVGQLDITVERVNHRIISQTSPNSGGQSVEGDYSYNYDAWQEKVKVWSGRLDVKNRRNETVRTIFPLQNITADLGYGAYIVTAKRATDKENNSRVAQAWRWVVSTDMAITSYRGAEFMHVNVRSLKSAQLKPQIRLELIAENNDILGQVVTDAKGRASFPIALLKGQGNSAPKMVLAYDADTDFAMLDLTRSPLDMTAYDVEGRSASGLIDIFAYTERGVYRPGETVYLTALLRGSDGGERFDRPVSLEIVKPDGGIALQETYEKGEMAGALAVAYELPEGAPRGLWTIKLTPEGLDTVKSLRFDVQDFVPQKLKVTTSLPVDVLDAQSRTELNIQADFLYGAVGANLDGEAEARVQIENQPFKGYEDYKFGDTQETFREQLIEVGVGVTNDEGRLSLPLNLRTENVSSSFPLRLMMTSGIAEPGGRYVQKTDYIPLRTQDSYIGFRAEFEGRYASHKEPVSLSIVNLSSQGDVKASDLEWRLFEEIHDFQWYREGGRWRYRKDVSDVALSSGEMTIGDEPNIWTRRLPRGQYRLEAISNEGVKGAIRFNVGWARPGAGIDAPDRIVMGKVENSVKPGDKITLSVNAPYAGQGDLVIANETVRSIQSVTLPEGESELTFDFNPSWGDSVYAMLTLYTAEDKTGKSIQRRAAGLSYISLNRSKQTLGLDFAAPEKIEPRQTYTLSVEVTNIPKGDTAWVSVAAVDEGILQLTQYDSPDAAEYYFGKKAFNLDVRDDYARLLNPNLGVAAILPQGGDSVGGAGLSVVPTQTVSLYSAPVKVKNGKASVELDIPDFQGSLRLMATAWSSKAVGSAEDAMIVRDSVPMSVGLPRFLAPGDKAIATVSVDNLDGPVGQYSLAFHSHLSTKENSSSFDLAQEERKDVLFALSAENLGVSDIDFILEGQNGYELTKAVQIETRSPFRPKVEKNLTRLRPDETYTFSASNLDGYIPATTDVSLSVSTLPGLDAQTYVQSLSSYPYGCTEQTVSKAMPLLFVAELGGLKDLSEPQRKARVDLAIKRIIARQDGQGSFGLWHVGDGNASPWLQLYVSEFLILASASGQDVPQDAIKKAISAAQLLSDPNRYSSLNLDYNYGWSRSGGHSNNQRKYERAAYAHYVLSLADKVDVPDLRYLADNNSGDIKDPLALTYLATALSKIGDNRRAVALYDKAINLQKSGKTNSDDYYASGLRNAAAMLAISQDYLSDSQASELMKYVGAAAQDGQYLNTQEQSYLVRMIAALGASDEDLSLETKNLTLTQSKTSQTVSFVGSSINGSRTIKNIGDKSLWVSETLSGLPQSDPGKVSEGYSLKKDMFTMSGEALSLSTLTKGEQAIIRISIDPVQDRAAMIVLADLLPAGLEIERILMPEEAGTGSLYSFVGKLSDLDLAEARDDRLVASKRLSRWDSQTVKVAYVVRAVTQGDFIFPGAVAEDMYRPDIRGRTAATRLTVTGTGSN